MSNVQVQFKRGDITTLDNTPITDGMIYFNTQNQHIYMDNGSESSDRIEYSNSMSNFMDKETIIHLINKSDANNYFSNVTPSKMNALIGDTTKINNVPIIDVLDDLYDSVLFAPVWSDNIHNAFNTKTIEIDGIYQFYIISTGSFILEYDEDDAFDEGTWVWHQDVSEFNGDNKLYDNYNYYDIIPNNNVAYLGHKMEFTTDNIVNNTRKVQITSNNSTNKTTFSFDRYGKYFNGVCVDYDESKNNKLIPFYIMGIKKNT